MEKNGIIFHAQLSYSPRFGNTCQITGGDLGNRAAVFSLSFEENKEFQDTTNPQEIDALILRLYGGKKGKNQKRRHG